DIIDVSEKIREHSGGGWGVDVDVGVQGNLDPIPLGPSSGLEIMGGLVGQNLLESNYPFSLSGGLKGRPPANDRRINLGVAARIKNTGVLEPLLSVEMRDLLTEHDEFLEYLHAAFELKMRP